MKRRSFLETLAVALAWPFGMLRGQVKQKSVFDELLPQPETVYPPARPVADLAVSMIGTQDASLAFDAETGEYVLRTFYPARSIRWSEYRAKPCSALINPGTGAVSVPATLYFDINDRHDYPVAVEDIHDSLSKFGIPGPQALAVRFNRILPDRRVADILSRHEATIIPQAGSGVRWSRVDRSGRRPGAQS